MEHHHKHHAIFIVITILLIIFVLTSYPQSTQSAPMSNAGIVCCTMQIETTTRVCVAPEGQTCDACNSICARG